MKPSSVLEWVTALIAVVGLLAVGVQIWQSNKHKRWDNYNAMNAAYHSLYARLYSQNNESLLPQCKEFSSMTEMEKAWIRAYFDLYAEEMWLDQEGLIPNGMFDKQIDGGVNLNLMLHPAMIDGFKYWRDLGAFKHPDEFIPFVEEKFDSLSPKIEQRMSFTCKKETIKDEVSENADK